MTPALAGYFYPYTAVDHGVGPFISKGMINELWSKNNFNQYLPQSYLVIAITCPCTHSSNTCSRNNISTDISKTVDLLSILSSID